MIEDKQTENMLNDLLKPTKETNIKILIDKVDEDKIYFSFSNSPYRFDMSKAELKTVIADIQKSLQEKARLSFQWVLIFYAYAEMNKNNKVQNNSKSDKNIFRKLLKIKGEALKFLRIRHKINLNINKKS